MLTEFLQYPELMESITINGAIQPLKDPNKWNAGDWQLGDGIGDRDEVFPHSLIYYKDLMEIVYKQQKWEAMGSDSKIIISWLCLAPDSEIAFHCGTPILKKITERGVAKFFRQHWGRLRTKKAIAEIKDFLGIKK